jgi:serine/threonine-protein kinase RsbW
MAEVLLEIPARPEYLHVVRQVVAAAAELEPTFPEERIEDLRIAVSEAATNAVEAHVGSGADERILLRCDLSDDRIQVEVLDRGGGFEAEGAGEVRRAEGMAEHGYGLPLMYELADEAVVTARDDGTAVRLTVFVPARFRR